ncbi:hypothetical protein [Pedobacter sp. GR22-6]|uniref:hypothetical protein n=1 Tax=Pedobacter sp. GR22-6 TaxID=3127957 RepID=UPI00307D21FC
MGTTTAYQQQSSQQATFRNLLPLIVEAKLHKVWLYHKSSGQWYTPEEFEQQFGNKVLSQQEATTLKQNLVLRDPRTGNIALQKAIRQKTEQYQREIAELTEKGERFLNKVIDYYRNPNGH